MNRGECAPGVRTFRKGDGWGKLREWGGVPVWEDIRPEGKGGYNTKENSEIGGRGGLHGEMGLGNIRKALEIR